MLAEGPAPGGRGPQRRGVGRRDERCRPVSPGAGPGSVPRGAPTMSGLPAESGSARLGGGAPARPTDRATGSSRSTPITINKSHRRTRTTRSTTRSQDQRNQKQEVDTHLHGPSVATGEATDGRSGASLTARWSTSQDLRAMESARCWPPCATPGTKPAGPRFPRPGPAGSGPVTACSPPRGPGPNPADAPTRVASAARPGVHVANAEAGCGETGPSTPRCESRGARPARFRQGFRQGVGGHEIPQLAG